MTPTQFDPLPGERTIEEAFADPGALDLLALLPCPLKVPIEESFRNLVSQHLSAGGAPFTFCVAGQANHEADLGAFAQERDPLRLPGIIISPGLNAIFRNPFYTRHIASGTFGRLDAPRLDAPLATAGLLDPARRCTMLSANLLVMAVDERALGDRPVPRRIVDLLDPAYAGSIAIRGTHDGRFCETLLLASWSRFGPEGIGRLARSTRHGWHPSQMVNSAGTGRSDAPAVSVLPLFFAEVLKGRPRVKVIWPEDGAVVSPVTMLVRADRAEALRGLVEFFRGPEIARICGGAGFPAIHPDAPMPIPPGAPLHWVGWDFVGENDLGALVPHIEQLFSAAQQGHQAEV